MIFGSECQWCDSPLNFIEGRHLANGGKIHQLCPVCGNRNEFGPLAETPKGALTLDAARSSANAFVVVRLDSGGMILFTAPVREVRCEEEDLISLTIKINQFTMGGVSGWSIEYEEHERPTALGGGRDGGWVGDTPWMHKQLQAFGLPRSGGEVLAAKRKPVDLFVEAISELPEKLGTDSKDSGEIQEGLSLFFHAIGFPTYARATDESDPENGYPVSARGGMNGPSIDGFCAADAALLRECLEIQVQFHGVKAPPGWPDEHHAVFTTLPASKIDGGLVRTASENRISLVCAEALQECPSMLGDGWARHNLFAALKGGLVTTFKAPPPPKAA